MSDDDISIGELFARLPPTGQEALLEGIRTGSPEPFRKWTEAWNKSLAGQKTISIADLPRTVNKTAAVPKTQKK